MYLRGVKEWRRFEGDVEKEEEEKKEEQELSL